MIRGNQVLVRVHGVFTFVNDVLLIPMFTLLVLEVCDAIATQGAAVFDLTNLGFCALFGAEWALGLAIAENRWAYLRNPLRLADLVSSIPVGHLFQSVRVVRLLRVLRLARAVWRAKRYQGPVLRLLRAVSIILASVGAGALAMRIVEPALVPDMFTAAWWSLSNLAAGEAVGVAPLTNGGRAVAALLATLGVGVIGYVAGFLATMLDDPEEQELLRICNRLESKMDEMSREMKGLRAGRT